MAAIIEQFFDFRVWIVILIFCAVEVSFNLAKYYVGRQGKAGVQARFPKISPERWVQVDHWTNAWGPPVLLFMAIPGVSTLLAVGAGISGYRPYTLISWNFLAVLIRNWVIFLLFFTGVRQFS